MTASRKEFLGAALLAGAFAGCRGVGVPAPAKARFAPFKIEGLEPKPDFWKVRPEEIVEVCERATKCSKKEIICRTPLGYPVYALFYGDFDDPPPQTTWPAGRNSTTYHNYYGNRADGKQTFLFIAGIHGAEPECTVSALNLIQMLETGRDFRGQTDAKLIELIGKYRLIVVPCVNMDGRSISPDHLRGVDWDTFRRASQGVWKADNSRIGWRGSKAWYPLPLDKVSYPGGYPNAEGYNINLDCVPGDIRTAEAKALLNLAARWRVDAILNGHSYEYAPSVIRSSSQDYPERIARSCEIRYRCNRALQAAGLLPGKLRPPEEDRPTRPYICIDEALKMACGGLVLCLECSVSYDVPDNPPKQRPTRTYTFEELMTPAFVVLKEFLADGLEKPFVVRGEERLLED